MWDLIVSVPDHCLSFYFECFQTALSNVSLKSDILLRILSFSKSRKYEFIRVQT